MDYLQIGKIVNTHGVRGEIKVIPLTDNPDRYNGMKKVYVEKNGSLELFDIESVKFSRGFVILKLKGIGNMDAAESLVDAFLVVDRKDAVKLPKDSYFICDIIGLDVYDENDAFLGKVAEVLSTGSNDVYVVRNEKTGDPHGKKRKDILIPALKSVVVDISIEKGTMKVVIPEGLIDDEI